MLFTLIMLPFFAFSQNSKTNIGLGAGIDYGGFGGRFTVLPGEKFGLFAALGYNLTLCNRDVWI